MNDFVCTEVLNMKSIFYPLKRLLYKLHTLMFLDVVLVRGRISASSEPMVVLLGVQRKSVTEGYFLDKTFDGPYTRIGSRRVFLPMLDRFIQKSGADLCILEMKPGWKGVKGGKLISTPKLVRQHIDLSEPMEVVKRKFRDRNKTIFNKYAKGDTYAVRISRSAQDFDVFYRDMFVPHVQRQFSGFAALDSHESLKAAFERGFLMIASANGVDVAATLCIERDNGLHYHRVGILNGDQHWVREGVQSALYVHMMLHAKSRNLGYLDLGMSRPFFDDGVYRHKRNWGAVVSDVKDENEVIYVMQTGRGSALREFLAHYPLIGHSGDSLVAYGSHPSDESDVALTPVDLKKKYGAHGIFGMRLLSRSGDDFHQVSFAA